MLTGARLALAAEFAHRKTHWPLAIAPKRNYLGNLVRVAIIFDYQRRQAARITLLTGQQAIKSLELLITSSKTDIS